MIKVINIKVNSTDFCLCGSPAVQIRAEEDEFGNLHSEDYFCLVCAKAADSMTPEDLI